ncbi:MAG TPA: hypothetical protein ENF41_00655 [Candidatus Bathyarchaeota archaeon]|nr:hypothetical protein [Candidatus Bathyarchaeota archaeon]
MSKIDAFIETLRSICQFLVLLGAVLSCYAFIKTGEDSYAIILIQLLILYELWRIEKEVSA